MKKSILLSLLVLASQLACTQLAANDGVYYTSGSTLIPMIETNLKVQKEVLTISFGDGDDAEVDVYYEFLNPTNEPKSVRMGFEANPPYAAFDAVPSLNSEHPFIYNFEVEFNGTKLGYKNALAWSDNEKFITKKDLETWRIDGWEGSISSDQYPDSVKSIAYVYYFDVTFAPGVNRVHHTYSYKMSESVGTTFQIAYKLSPASRWAGGRIGDFTLNINVPNTAKHFLAQCASLVNIDPKVTAGMGKFRRENSADENSVSNTMEISLRKGSLSWHVLNFAPEDELYICSADVHTTFDREAPLGAYYDRTNTMQLQSPYADDEEDGKSAKNTLPEELRKAIIRNLPYAHRGRIFKRKDLDQYFRSLWWYMPDPNYTDDTSDFTESDWYYVRRGK